MTAHGVDLNTRALRAFCSKWQIRELGVFGSILRDDFRPDSDIDFLVAFDEAAPIGVLEPVEMEQELGAMFGRTVDLVERRSVERSPNYIRRSHILHAAERVYAQG